MSLSPQITHRDQQGPTYKGIFIHALPGLHEYAAELTDRHFNKDMPILELAAGSGALSLRLQDKGYQVHPVDLDGNDWRLETPLIQADFNKSDWYQEALLKKCYRQIIALEVIEHLENPSKFFRDIAQILEPGGKLILSTPNVFAFPSLYSAFKHGEFALFSPADCIHSGHISILPWWLMRHLAERMGLRVVHCEGVCYVPLQGLRKWFVAAMSRLRQRVFAPQDFSNFEGLSAVMVFEKPLVSR